MRGEWYHTLRRPAETGQRHRQWPFL
ncbi:hypothetical protein C8J43_1208, partial [Sphingomonas sp. PP-CE-1G-424]